MKTVLLLRHAKSSWSNPSLADINRPLNKRGKRDAPRIGEFLYRQDLIPDTILCSPALRARKTAKAIAEESGYPGEIEIYDDFYPGDPDSFIEVLSTLPDRIASALIVAHNPGLEEFLYTLSGESARMPTSALAEISLAIETWSEIDDDFEGKLINLWRVKELG